MDRATAIPGDARVRTRIRAGSLRQRFFFGLLLAIALIGFLLAFTDKLERFGTPNVGWMMDGWYVSPTRTDASEAGLRGGGRALRINGVSAPAENLYDNWSPPVDQQIGATNTLTIVTPAGNQRELTLPVQPWSVRDFVFTEGGTDVIGLLFIVVGVASFMLRPYAYSSWALLSLACLAGAGLLLVFVPMDRFHPATSLTFLVQRMNEKGKEAGYR